MKFDDFTDHFLDEMSNRRQPNLTTSEHHEKPPHRRVDDCAVVEEIYLFVSFITF